MFTAPPPRPTPLPPRRKAYTLIEILVAVLICALLIGLAAGALRGARWAALDTVSDSNLRQHAQSLTSYSTDYRVWPHFTQVGFLVAPVRGLHITVTAASYFDAHHTWHLILAEPYYSVAETSDVFFPPRFKEEAGHGYPHNTPYHYGCVFIASPEYWNPHTRMGPAQYRATRPDEVLYPSRKALVSESWPYVPRAVEMANPLAGPALPAAFVDGSARGIKHEHRANGYERGDGYQFQNAGAVHMIDWPPTLHTLDGARGRDVR